MLPEVLRSRLGCRPASQIHKLVKNFRFGCQAEIYPPPCPKHDGAWLGPLSYIQQSNDPWRPRGSRNLPEGSRKAPRRLEECLFIGTNRGPSEISRRPVFRTIFWTPFRTSFFPIVTPQGSPKGPQKLPKWSPKWCLEAIQKALSLFYIF